MGLQEVWEENILFKLLKTESEQDPCSACGYEEGSIYCKEHCPHEAKIERESCEDCISRQAEVEPQESEE